MFRSLRGRLIVLLVLLTAAAIAAGALMIGLFRQSATAQAGQAEAEIGRACDAIGAAYRLYSAGWPGRGGRGRQWGVAPRPDRGRAVRTESAEKSRLREGRRPRFVAQT